MNGIFKKYLAMLQEKFLVDAEPIARHLQNDDLVAEELSLSHFDEN